jgi:hypothetical protein
VNMRNLPCSLTLLSTLFLLPAAAGAYTDPGSGALLWQMLMAAFVGVMFSLRRMANWFRSRRKD